MVVPRLYCPFDIIGPAGIDELNIKPATTKILDINFHFYTYLGRYYPDGTERD
jgi:hypothetical protein